MPTFESRTALITGGSRGIGRAAAFALAEAGADVAIMARSAADVQAATSDLQSAGHCAVGVVADVADPRSLEAAVGEAADAPGSDRQHHHGRRGRARPAARVGLLGQQGGAEPAHRQYRGRVDRQRRDGERGGPGTGRHPDAGLMREQADLLGPQVSAMFHRFHEQGELRDPSEPARLVAGLVQTELSGKIVALSSPQAEQLLRAA